MAKLGENVYKRSLRGRCIFFKFEKHYSKNVLFYSLKYFKVELFVKQFICYTVENKTKSWIMKYG